MHHQDFRSVVFMFLCKTITTYQKTSIVVMTFASTFKDFCKYIPKDICKYIPKDMCKYIPNDIRKNIPTDICK